MARIRIELPERFTFSTDIPLLVSHINYGNHLDNAQLLGIVSEARVRFLKSMGYSELDIEGLGIITEHDRVEAPLFRSIFVGGCAHGQVVWAGQR